MATKPKAGSTFPKLLSKGTGIVASFTPSKTVQVINLWATNQKQHSNPRSRISRIYILTSLIISITSSLYLSDVSAFGTN